MKWLDEMPTLIGQTVSLLYWKFSAILYVKDSKPIHFLFAEKKSSNIVYTSLHYTGCLTKNLSSEPVETFPGNVDLWTLKILPEFPFKETFVDFNSKTFTPKIAVYNSSFLWFSDSWFHSPRTTELLHTHATVCSNKQKYNSNHSSSICDVLHRTLMI